MNRIEQTLAHASHSKLATYFVAGDPDFDTSLTLLRGLATAGADLIELGLPFSDPVADGPAIQAAQIRARAAGQTVARTLELVRRLRETDAATPLVLMGYVNPVMQYDAARFMRDAAQAGADGLILVDLPLEYAAPWRKMGQASGLHLIAMSAPTTDSARLQSLADVATGFIYHVTVAGTTGAAACVPEVVAHDLARLRAHTPLPVAAGFGIRAPAQVGALAGVADLIVVGSSLVETLAAEGVEAVLAKVAGLRAAIPA